MSSPVVVGEDGSGAPPAGMAGFEFGIDPNEDPELALVKEYFSCILSSFTVLYSISMKIIVYYFQTYSRRCEYQWKNRGLVKKMKRER